jgi:hypothetical protein
MPGRRGRQPGGGPAYFDLDSLLLHPSGAFGHPYQVVDDPDLTLNEKHAVLAAWAADAYSVCPGAKKSASGAGQPVKFEDIVAALREIGEQLAHGNRPRPHYRRILNMRGRPGDRPPLS